MNKSSLTGLGDLEEFKYEIPCRTSETDIVRNDTMNDEIDSPAHHSRALFLKIRKHAPKKASKFQSKQGS